MAEFIVDYVMRLEMEKEFDLWTKKNIINYTSDPDEKNDKRYPPSLQKARKILLITLQILMRRMTRDTLPHCRKLESY